MSTSQDSTQSRRRAEWLPSRDTYLVELFVDNHNAGKGSQNGFTNDVFKLITRDFNQYFGLSFEDGQIKYRYNVLKKDWGVVKALRSHTGFGWDEDQKMVVAEDKVWDSYIAVHGDAKPFRRKGFPLYDRLSIIFGGQRATGKFQVSSAQVASEDGNSNANDEQPSRSTIPQTIDIDATQDDSSSSSDSIFQLDGAKSKKRKFDAPTTSGQKKRVRPKTGDKIANAFFEMAKASRMRATQKVEENWITLYQKCIKELQKMEELEESEFLKSVHALKEDKNAIAFMTTKDPLCLAFLRSLWQ